MRRKRRKVRQVSNRFTGNQLPCRCKPGRLEIAELIDHAVSARVEILLVVLRSTSFQVPLRIKLAARVVVPMCDFMTDDCANRAVVDGIVGVRLKKGACKSLPGNEISLLSEFSRVDRGGVMPHSSGQLAY